MSPHRPALTAAKAWTAALFAVTLAGLLAPAGARAAPILLPGNLQHSGYGTRVVAADVDGDGRTDIVVATGDDSGPQRIQWVRNAGGRRWDAGREITTFPSTANLLGLAMGDLDGDGHPDLVFSFYDNVLGSKVKALYGAAGGLFGPQVPVPLLPLPAGGGLIVADIDEDHLADVATLGGGPYALQIALARPDRTWIGVAIPLTGSPFRLNQGDLDGNGDPDFIITETITDTATVLLGVPGTTFGASYTIPGAGGGESAVADFTADGIPDIALTSSHITGVTIFPGVGGGAVGGGMHFDLGGPSASNLVTGDFTQDGIQDLAIGTTCFGYPCATGYRNLPMIVGSATGTPTLRPASLPLHRTLYFGSRMIGGDFDADGRPDLVLTLRTADRTWVLYGSGNGGFDLPALFAVGRRPGPAFAADLDQDGDLDLLVGNRDSGDLSILRGDGQGGFAPAVSLPLGAALADLAFGDVDADGLPDAVALLSSPASIVVTHARGDGGFDVVRSIALADVPRLIALTDLNLDGRLDVVVSVTPAAASNGTLQSWLQGTGGALTLAGSVSVQGIPRQMRAGDITLDGLPDIVLAIDYRLDRALGRGDGTLAAVQPATAVDASGTFAPLSLLLHDVDGDGVLDSITGSINYQDAWVRVLHGNIGGAFDINYHSPGATSGLFPAALALGDVDGDGTINILAANHDSDDLSIFQRNPITGPARLLPDQRFQAGPCPANLATGDFDGDLRVDVAVVHDCTDSVSLILNQGVGPRAVVATPGAAECTGPAGAGILLDGSGSTDPDSSPGTNDDLVSFAWYEDYGTPAQQALGSGETLGVTLRIGTHAVTLVVTDSGGATDSDSVTVTVTDTTPPVFSVLTDPAILWPPNHALVPVSVQWSAQDSCSAGVLVELIAVESSEPDDAAGYDDGATAGDVQGAIAGSPDGSLLLRAERDGKGPGRTYILHYRAVDAAGNATPALGVVTVPHDQGSGFEPLVMRLEPTGGASDETLLFWPAIAGALSYDVLRVNRAALHVQDGVLHLGTATVLARGTVGTSVLDQGAPQVGEVWIYLAQQVTDHGPVGYGTESAPWPRVPEGCVGGCPAAPPPG